VSETIYTAPPRATFWQKLGPGGLASLGLAFLGLLLVVPVLWRLRQVLRATKGDEPEQADAVLVLGRRLQRNAPTQVFEARLARACALWKEGFAPRIIVAGGTTGGAEISEAEAGLIWLKRAGLPESALLGEAQSQHTLENLFHVRAMMAAQGWSQILLVSDPLHLARAKAMAEGFGMRVKTIPATDCPPRRGSLGWCKRAAFEAFLLNWYLTGSIYSRLIRSEAQLARIS
jgi:uncharacterized SAM-binding protein YcdF (DUF218 family)